MVTNHIMYSKKQIVSLSLVNADELLAPCTIDPGKSRITALPSQQPRNAVCDEIASAIA